MSKRRAEMDLVILSCAVRYALGDQRTVIREDVARWLEQMGSSDYVAGAGWSTGRPAWEELLRWIDSRTAADQADGCPRCGSVHQHVRFSSDNGRTHCGHGWHREDQ